MQRFDVIIIGQGYSGLKAAKAAAEKGRKVAVVERMLPGGLVTSVNELDPVPEGETPSGPELTGDLAMGNMDLGVTNFEGDVRTLAHGTDGWRVATDADELAAPRVVVASGARLRKLGVPGEREFAGMGVSECADCDGPIYQGKSGVVVGGGDSAFQEALALAVYASDVTVVMRGDAPRARPHLVEAVEAHPAISIRRGEVVTAVVGEEGVGVTGVELRGRGGATTLPCSAVFAFVGLRPDTDFVPSEVARDEAGAIVTDADLRAGPEGLWAIGAARAGFGGLMTDANDDVARLLAAL